MINDTLVIVASQKYVNVYIFSVIVALLECSEIIGSLICNNKEV